MRTGVARILITCAFAIVAGGCGMIANHVRLETNEPEWTLEPGLSTVGLSWRGDDTSLSVLAAYEPCGLPVTVRVTNHYGGALGVALERRAPSGTTDSNLGTWWIDGAEDPPQPLASGMEITVPGPNPEGRRSTVILRLPADRAWTADEPVRQGDTVSYDMFLNRGAVRTTRPLRLEVTYVGNELHWWTPLVFGAIAAVAVYEPAVAVGMLESSGP